MGLEEVGGEEEEQQARLQNVLMLLNISLEICDDSHSKGCSLKITILCVRINLACGAEYGQQVLESLTQAGKCTHLNFTHE